MKTPPHGPTRPSRTGPSAGKTGASPAYPASSRSADVERALALRDVMDHAVMVQREISKPTVLRTSRVRPILATIFCVPLIALCLYSWVARPAIIWGPRMQAISPGRQEANARFAMFLLAQRLESYRHAEGIYPSSLAAIGESSEGISYNIVSDSVFELRATHSGKPIVLRSRDDMEMFLANSAVILAGRGQ